MDRLNGMGYIGPAAQIAAATVKAAQAGDPQAIAAFHRARARSPSKEPGFFQKIDAGGEIKPNWPKIGVAGALGFTLLLALGAIGTGR